jgi:transcriptional regulator with XRE-family HTH domain
MEIEFGRKIKELRHFYGISQKEVCEGICNQSYISKLEKGMVHPSANMLAMIADRLGVSPQYFFDDFADVTKVNYVYQVIDYISKNMERAKYEEVLEMVEGEKNNPLFKRPHLQQFLLWRKGICVYHLYGDEREAVDLFNQSLAHADTTTKNKSERELDILLSKAIVFSLEERYIEADEIYEELLLASRKHPYLPNEALIPVVYYNYSKNKYLQKQYLKALNLAKSGVVDSLEHNSIYMLGDLYFQCGKCLWFSNKSSLKESLHYLEMSKHVFILRENEEFAELVQEEIDEIKAESEETEGENIPE